MKALVLADATGLQGASEVLASIGQLEFFYAEAPESMRSLCMALQLVSTSLGSYLSAAILNAVDAVTKKAGHEWVPPTNLNEGHLDYFFALLAGIMLADTLIFVLVATRYRYKE